MTRDDIIRMGREVGIDPMVGTVRNGKYEPKVNALKHSVPVEWLESFAELVAAVEREECAKINDAKAERLAQEAEDAARESDAETVTAIRAAALLLIVCAANIRARKDSA